MVQNVWEGKLIELHKWVKWNWMGWKLFVLSARSEKCSKLVCGVCVCVCVCVAFWCVVLSAVSQTKFCTIDVTENIAVLCHYAASIGNSLPMFRDNTLDGADKSFRNVGNELSLLAA